MSVQLILYPQSYDGVPNPISSNVTEFVVDGNNFNTINTSTIYGILSAPFPQKAIDYFEPTLLINQWDRYRSSTLATISQVSGDIIFPTGDCGIIQKLSNLTIGIVYNVSIEISVTSAQDLFFNTYNGTVLNSSVILTQSVGVVSTTFTSNSTEQIILIGTSGNGSVNISSISVLTSSVATPIIGNGQVILDLYEDEDLPLTLSVDNFKNVAEKVQSYSKAFNLPATKRNNKIFDQVFEITRSDDGIIFNVYKKTQCVLKQDGFILFEGYLRLLDVTDKNGEISYSVNLYSEVIALADFLKDSEFRDLDFSELTHDYNISNIKDSWNDSGTGIFYTYNSTSGFRDDNSTLKYPFIDWNHQYIRNTSTGTTILPNLESAFRPCINIKYLIDRIFQDSPFTYSSNLFNDADFKKLYMDFNWGSENYGAAPLRSGGFTQAFNTSSGSYWFNSSWTKFKLQDNTSGTNTLWDNTDYKFVSDVNNLEVTADYYLRCQNDTGSSRANDVRISKFNILGQAVEVFDQDNSSIGGNLTKTLQGTFTTILQTGEYIQAQSSSPTANTVRISESSPMSNIVFSFQNNGAQVVPLLDVLRGELGQWEFIKGILTMFNLITMPDEDNPNNILIEPYSDVFINNTSGTTLASRSIQHDWTDKIDVSEMKLTPLTDLNRNTIFKFVEDEDDFVFNQYKFDVGGHLYGSLKYDATDEFNILEGTDEIIAEPFAATVVKALMDNFPDFITPSVYAMDKDGITEGFENSPRIMYNNGVKDSGTSYYIPAQNGGSETIAETDFLQFSHLSTIPADGNSLDFHFGWNQLMTGVGAGTLRNLFNLYWLPYYAELYNPNTRSMTIKVNLTPSDISLFKFNDTVMIKNRIFRVNKIDYKPNDLATVEFILIP